MGEAGWMLVGFLLGMFTGVSLGVSGSHRRVADHARELLREAVGKVEPGEGYYLSVSVGRTLDDDDGGDDEEIPLPGLNEKQEHQWQ